MDKNEKIYKKFIVAPGKKINLKKLPTAYLNKDNLSEKEIKKKAKDLLKDEVEILSEAQNRLYASDTYSVLLIFQAMDAAGKDTTIKHVMSGVNPQGCQVFSFKHPSSEELDHDYMWRYAKALPERGRIGIFNRSYYEEVLIVKVHKHILMSQRIPNLKPGKSVWEERYEAINNFEKHLAKNGTLILKFFLHLSKDEQKKRFLERLDDKTKNWKFSSSDIKERQYWDEYQSAYEEAISKTSSKHAPWFVVPADNKWATRAIVSKIVSYSMGQLNLKYPVVSAEQKKELERARSLLVK